MVDFIETLEEHKVLFSFNNGASDPEPPKPVTETEEVEEDVRPGGEKEDNPKK